MPTLEPNRTVADGEAKPEARPELAPADAELAAWRGKAANILLAASAVLHLPAFVLFMAGYGPSGSLVRALCFVVYLVMLASALLRRVEYRTRLGAYFIAAYVVVALGNLADPSGTYAKVGLIVNPILALVLCGSTAAGVLILASGVILVSSPFVRVLPGVAGVLAINPDVAAVSPRFFWFQATGLAAFLATVMILLDRFHRFLWDALTAQCRATFQVERKMREIHRLEREIAAVADGERRRLGHELHDGVCQQVTAAQLRCRALARSADRGQRLVGADFEPLSSLLTDCVEETRSVALGLCPLDADPEALAPALRALARRMEEMGSVRCDFLAAGDVRVPDRSMAQHLYRIAQEALSNAVRHAHANRIAVELRGTESELTLQVEDDGVGLSTGLPAGGMGLRTMSYRAQIIGGELTITSASGRGARVTCRVVRAAGEPVAPRRSGDHRWSPAG